MIDKNSLTYWYPLVKGVVPTPRTEIIPFDPEWGDILLEGEEHPPSEFYEAMEKAKLAGDEFGWPCFLRTDHCAGKHEWSRTCFLSKRADLVQHVAALAEYSAMADIMGIPFTALVVREFLQCESPFTTFRGMPVTMERRLFLRNDRVICNHPYWPPEAVEEGRPSINDWRDRLDSLNRTYTNYDAHVVETLGQRVAKACPGFWSADFIKSMDGWYLTDMALGEDSFHWPGCKNSPMEDRPHRTTSPAEAFDPWAE